MANLGFSFQLAGGTGKLSLREQRFFDWLQVDRLELEVPGLELPVDLADGPRRFQRRRTRVTLASLRMDQTDLDRFVAARAPALAAIGVDELALRACEGYLAVSCRARDDQHAADLTGRIYLRGRGARLQLIAADSYLYGYLSTSAPVLAHRILIALLGDSAEVRGLGDVDVTPLSSFLWSALPRAGWRLPDASAMEMVAARSARGAVEVSYAPGVNGARPGAAARGASDSQMPEAAAYLEALKRFRDGDEYLIRRDVDSALRAYRAQLDARGPDQPYLVKRILAVASSHPAWFRDADDLARDALARWPEYIPALCARAAIAVAEGNVREAAEQFGRMADAAARVGDDEATARAALAGARLLRATEPPRATALYERALTHRPGHAESIEALLDRYEDEERWQDLVRLLRSRIAATSDRERQAGDHVRLAVVLRDALAEPVRARDELELATQLAPDQVAAWEALADTLVAMGDRTLAIRALDTTAELYRTRGDARGEARAHVQAALAWQQGGDDDRAAARFQRALDLAPDYSPALEGAARLAEAAGRCDEAAELLERRLAAGGLDAAARTALLRDLGACLVRAGRRDDARSVLLEAANARVGAPSAEAWALLADLDREADRLDDAADGYAMAVAGLMGDAEIDAIAAEVRERAATLAVARAQLLDTRADYELAYRLDPTGASGRAAARALYDKARAAEDHETCRRWIGALIYEGMPAGDEIDARLTRADLELRAGDAAAASIDLDRVLADRLATEMTADQRARSLALEAELAGAAGDALSRARALAQRAEHLGQRPDGGAAVDALIDAAEAWLAADDTSEALTAARRAAVYIAEETDAGDAATARRRRGLRALGAAAWRRRAWPDVARAYAPLVDDSEATSAERARYGHRLGVACDKQGQLEQAVAALERVTAEPEAAGEALATSWRVLAGLYERTGDSLAAASAFEAFASDRRPNAPEAALADAWYRAGELYRKQEHGEHGRDAERCLEAALRITPDHMPALDALERLKVAEEDWDRVAVILGRKLAATQRQPARQKALLARLADLQAHRLGRADVALETYRRALSIDPDFRPALRFVAAHGRIGDASEAIDAFRRLARELPGDTETDVGDDDALADERRQAALDLASLLAERGRAGEAVDTLDEVLVRTGDDPQLLDALCGALRSSKQWAAAAEALGRLAAATTDSAVALQSDLQRIAIYGSHIDDPGAAWAACRAALSRSPEDPALLATAVAMARNHGDPADCVDVLVAAANSDRACRLASTTAADLLVEAAELCGRAIGDADRATELYGRALERDPQHAAARAGLGRQPAPPLEDDDVSSAYQAVPEVVDQETSDALEAARALFDEGDASAALALLTGVDPQRSSLSLLELRAELGEACEQWEAAAADLQALRARAAAAGETALEHQTTRRLAALTLERLHDHAEAASLYERALTIDGDDMAAAEALAGIYGRQRDRSAHIEALEQVLAIARRTCAGPAREAAVLRELARAARADRQLERAAKYLDDARAAAPYDLQALRARAELAVAQGDYAVCAECLESLASRLQSADSDEDTDFGRANSAGEILLELAGVYSDMMQDPDRGRRAIRRAAQAFGDTARGDAALRMLASQALGEQDDEEVVSALDSIAPERRTQADLVNLAKALKRLGRDRRAIRVLEEARGRGPMPDDAAMLLFALHRELKRKAALAQSLERGAYEQPPEVARTRLREALIIYDQSLEDTDNATRLRERLSEYAPTFTPSAPSEAPAAADAGSMETPSSPAELEHAAAHAIETGDTAAGADLLARAIATRARALDGEAADADDDLRATLRKLREVARGGGHYDALARGMLAASAIQRDAGESLATLREIAAIRLTHLRDARGAADALARALALAPADTELFAELDSALREIGDFAQLAAAYELHLSALAGVARVGPLRELAKIWSEVFRDEARAAGYESEARELAGDEVEPKPPAEPPAADAPTDAAIAQVHLRRAREFEERGQIVAAISQYEAASAADPGDVRALASLERLYEQRGDIDALTEILGRQIVAASSNRERARVWYRRAKLYRDVLHREPETYRCLKEAYANDPNNRDIAYALRSVAMARGEWALAAELVYREIDSAPSTAETAALHLELAMIYDEKLLDAGQARVNYEQALSLDPEIPAAPAPLARLYELAGRHDDAARMSEIAARYAADDDTRSRLLRRAAACAERAGRKDDARRLYGLGAMFAADAADSDAAQASVARLSTDPGDRYSRMELLEMRLSESADPEEQQDIRHQLLDLAVAAGETAAIRRHAGALLEEDAGDLSAFLALKRAATAVGDWSILAYLLRTRAGAVDDRVERAALFYELGRVCLDRLNDAGGAIAAFEQALSADPRHPAALEALADIAYLKNDWQRARELYSRLRPESCSLPPDVLAYRRGEVCEALGDLDEAAGAYAEACKVCPSNRMALGALARAALQLGDLSTAIDASRAMIDFLPPSDVAAIIAARIQVAELCRRAGDAETAADYYEVVLREDPNALNALAPLADLYRTLERWQDLATALTQLANVAATPRERAELEFQRGEVFREHLADPERAAEAYLRAIDLEPTHTRTLRRLVEYYARVGDDASAMEIIGDLIRQEALFSPDTGQPTMARALLAARAAGDAVLARRIAGQLGDPRALAYAMIERATRNPASARASVEAARGAIRDGAAVTADELAAALTAAATDDNAGEALARALSEG